jgi:flavin-dependent dehydrogenase
MGNCLMKDFSETAHLNSVNEPLNPGVETGPAISTIPATPSTLDEPLDVVVLGGGLAGLTLAVQLRINRPDLKMLVIEKGRFPKQEAAFKVGESTQEGAAYYFKYVLGMKEHLKWSQLPKLGVRFFFKAGDNSDIARRLEAGRRTFAAIPSFQLDRGRFENALAERCREGGTALWDACEVEKVALGDPLHRVTVRKDNQNYEVSARWVIDASGRRGLLKKQLGLSKQNDHNVSAVWFRLDSLVDLNEWSNDPAWLERVPGKLRWLSTNHLMGEGYWVWLIPLASGSISIGIVADPKYHPFETINRFDRALEWLRRYEPQCAAFVEAKQAKLQDFKVLKKFSYGCEKLFSADRWCLTGEAGVFLDPLYSVGSDFIAISNTIINQLIIEDLEGGSIEAMTREFNQLYLGIFESYLKTFEGQYGLFGNSQVMLAKIVWDTTAYWGFVAFLLYHNRFCDLNFMNSIFPLIQRFLELQATMQQFFRDWHQHEHRQWENDFVEFQEVAFLKKLNHNLATRMDDDRLRWQMQENINLMESLAAGMRQKAGLNQVEPLPASPSPPNRPAFPSETVLERGMLEVPGDNGLPTNGVEELEKIWFDSLEHELNPL